MPQHLFVLEKKLPQSRKLWSGKTVPPISQAPLRQQSICPSDSEKKKTTPLWNQNDEKAPLVLQELQQPQHPDQHEKMDLLNHCGHRNG